MKQQRLGWTIAGLLAIGTAALGHGAAPASAGTAVAVRYASPDGVASPTCPKSNPCDLLTAYNEGSHSEPVVIEPGVYYQNAPLATTLYNPDGITNAGGTGKGATPIIYMASDIATGSQGTLHDVSVVYSGPNIAVIGNDTSMIDHVTIHATATGAAACTTNGGTIKESVCLASGDDGTGVRIGVIDQAAALSETAALANVTVAATGASGTGIDVSAGANASITLSATNVIAKGTSTDVRAYASAASSTAQVNIDHSDFVNTSAASPGGGVAAITTSADNVTKDPKFLDATLQESAKSPTVDKGAPSHDATDLAGEPRTLGTAPDIGAFELVPPPKSPRMKVIGKGKHTVRVIAKINPHGVPTTLRLVGRHGAKHVKAKAKSAGSGHKSTSVHLTLHGLSRHTRYTIEVVAASDGGVVLSKTRTAKTK